MLPHLNRPGYGLCRFQGKTHFQSKHRSQPSLGSCRDGRQSGELHLTEVSAAVRCPEHSRLYCSLSGIHLGSLIYMA